MQSVALAIAMLSGGGYLLLLPVDSAGMSYMDVCYMVYSTVSARNSAVGISR